MKSTDRRDIPRLPGVPLLGNLLAFRRDRLHVMLRVAQCGDAGQCRLGPLRIVLLNSSELVRAALIDQADAFEKAASPRVRAIMQQQIGNGLLASDGAAHRQQRKLIAPAFQPRHLQTYAQWMTGYTTQVLDHWAHGDTIDLDHALWELTLRISGRTLFDADIAHEANVLRDALTTVTAQSNALASSPLPLVMPLRWLPGVVRLRCAVARLDTTVYRMIAERRHGGADRGDLLSLLLRARDDDAHGMTDVQLRDEAMTLFLAGYETTAIALTWICVLLAQHLDVQRRLQEEGDRVLAGRLPTMIDLDALPYTRQVCQEVLRLYPPLYVMARWAKQPVDLEGMRIPARSMVVVSPYTLHRRADYFPDPERFDPERFTPEAIAARPRYAYVPFGAGPRQCIGNHFAMMELQLILATVMQRMTLHLAPSQHITPDPQITLRPKAGVQMIVEHRARS